MVQRYRYKTMDICYTPRSYDLIVIPMRKEIYLQWSILFIFRDPTPTTSELLPVKWTPITNTTLPYLDIDLEMQLDNRPFHDRMAFWDLFYKKYGHFQKWYKDTDEGTDPDADDETETDSDEEDNNSYRSLASPTVIFFTLLYFFVSDF